MGRGSGALTTHNLESHHDSKKKNVFFHGRIGGFFFAFFACIISFLCGYSRFLCAYSRFFVCVFPFFAKDRKMNKYEFLSLNFNVGGSHEAHQTSTMVVNLKLILLSPFKMQSINQGSSTYHFLVFGWTVSRI